ncbi:MAG: cohesin domain-containing protein [Desulfobacterales bacterium]
MGFLATAASKEPGISGKGSGDDVWTIDHNLQLVNTVNGCACGNSQDGLRGCAVECWPQDQGLIGQISASDTELTLTVSLSKTENALGSFGFDLLYAPYALKFKTSLPGLLLQNFDKFSVQEISPGRIRAGGYTTGTPIPENTDGTLATLTFDILSPCSTDLKFVSLKDSMVSWQEHQIQFGTLTGNGLADAIALLRIAAGQNAEIPACIPDIGNDGRKGLAEAVWLLQWAAELR